MKCPRCGFENQVLENGQLVVKPMEQCALCAYIISSTESEQFAERCAEKIMQHITAFKRTKDKAYIYRADTYFQTLLEEVYGDVDQ